MMFWYDGHMTGWGYALMAVSTLVFWGLIIAGLVILVRYLRSERQRGRPAERSPAEHVLAERFARGEIDEEDYRRRLEVLQGTGRPTCGG